MTNPFSLEGKNAWITGASYGIGFNIAKAFVAAGVKNIIFNDINEDALKRGLDNYAAAGITMESKLVDVRHILVKVKGGFSDTQGNMTHTDEEWAERIVRDVEDDLSGGGYGDY